MSASGSNEMHNPNTPGILVLPSEQSKISEKTELFRPNEIVNINILLQHIIDEYNYIKPEWYDINNCKSTTLRLITNLQTSDRHMQAQIENGTFIQVL